MQHGLLLDDEKRVIYRTLWDPTDPDAVPHVLYSEPIREWSDAADRNRAITEAVTRLKNREFVK